MPLATNMTSAAAYVVNEEMVVPAKVQEDMVKIDLLVPVIFDAIEQMKLEAAYAASNTVNSLETALNMATALVTSV